MSTFEITDNTPLAALNIGQFKELIGELTLQVPRKQIDQLPETLGKDECSRLTGYSKNTINKMVSLRKIPHYKSGARVLFNRKEIMDWLLANRVPTAAEFVENNDRQLSQRRR